MHIHPDTHKKMLSAYQLLRDGTISVSTFEHIRTIVKGIHPEIDKKMEICSHAFDKLQKIQSADFITLSAEGLPEDTEDKKKRKQALLFFISSLKDLRNEIKRIDTEFAQTNNNENSAQNQLTAWGRIIHLAKGPLGILTLIALVVFGFSLMQRPQTQSASPVSPKTVVQIINYQEKQVPLSQLHIAPAHIPNCDSPHYHANAGSVKALDETVIADPENCGYGKLKDVKITEFEI